MGFDLGLLVFFFPTDKHFVYFIPLRANAFLLENVLSISKRDRGILLKLHLHKLTLRASPRVHSSSSSRA